MKQNEFLATATEIRILVSMLTKLTRQEFQDHLDTFGLGISMGHHGVLRFLRHHSFTISELSKHMNMEPASLVPIVDDLERKGWIRRTVDPADRRRTPLVLTAEGEQFLATMPSIGRSSPFFRTLEEMGDEKTTDLLERLRELVAGMSDNKSLVPELSKSVRIQIAARTPMATDRKSKPTVREDS